MNILTIARKDLRVLFKEPGTIIGLFLLPIVFILVFGGIAAATANDPEIERIPLPVVNLSDGPLARRFVRGLENGGGVEVILYDQAEAEQLYEAEEISRLLTIPADFDSRLDDRESVTIRVLSSSTNQDQNNSIGLVIEGVARSMSLENQILASLEQIGAMQQANPPEQQVFTAERNVAQAQAQFESSEDRPLIEVEQSVPESLGEEAAQNLTSVQLAVPGMTVLFVFLTAQTTAKALYDEKKVGSFRRLLAAPLGKSTLLGGKMLPNFVIVVLQVAFIFLVAILIFPLIGMEKLTLGGDTLALILLVLAIALCSTCVGIFIAAVAKTENQIGGFSQVILWVAGFIGGTIVPFFLMSGFMADMGKVTPQYWAASAFNEVMVLGGDLGAISLNLGVLLLFALVFFGISLWRFDYN